MCVGLGAALVLTPLLQTQLWGDAPTDPATFLAAAVVLLLVRALAGVVPARRATTVNPTIALRAE